MATDWLLEDPLDAVAIGALLRTRALGRRLDLHRRLGSTNDAVQALARAGAAAGIAVLAEEQVAGRGREGRPWISSPGAGVWISVLVERPRSHAGLLALGAGVAVARSLERAAGVGVELKWPNDLEIGGAKLGGMLGEGNGTGTVALGIGLNVHEAPPAAAIGRPATCLDRAAGRVVARNPVVARLLDELELMTDALAAGPAARAALLGEWRRHCNHLGRRVEVRTGSQARAGIATGVDAEGALLVELDDGALEPVVAGSLRVLSGSSPALPPRP